MFARKQAKSLAQQPVTPAPTLPPLDDSYQGKKKTAIGILDIENWQFTTHRTRPASDLGLPGLEIRFVDYDYATRPLPAECHGKNIILRLVLRGYGVGVQVGLQTGDDEWPRQRIFLPRFSDPQTVELVVNVPDTGGRVTLQAKGETIIVEDATVEILEEWRNERI